MKELNVFVLPANQTNPGVIESAAKEAGVILKIKPGGFWGRGVVPRSAKLDCVQGV
jgi:hypothetical protein